MKKLLLVLALVLSALSATRATAFSFSLAKPTTSYLLCQNTYCNIDTDCYAHCGDGGGYCIRTQHHCVPY